MKVNKSSIIDALKRSYLTSDSPQPTSKRKDFHTILAEHACFTQPQIWKEQKKASGWQNQQKVVVERLLMLEPSISSSKVL